jgi:hypothetical protein
MAEESAEKIGWVTTSGAYSEFAIPPPASNPDGITAGPGAARA